MSKALENATRAMWLRNSQPPKARPRRARRANPFVAEFLAKQCLPQGRLADRYATYVCAVWDNLSPLTGERTVKTFDVWLNS